MPHLSGIAETALYVQDIEHSRDFYQRVLSFPEIAREGHRLIALGVAHRQVLLLFSIGLSTHPTEAAGGRIPPHDGHGTLHLAFSIELHDVQPWRDCLENQGVPIESEVDCENGGHSIYFRDPDGHLVELITRGCWSNE